MHGNTDHVGRPELRARSPARLHAFLPPDEERAVVCACSAPGPRRTLRCRCRAEARWRQRTWC